VRPSSIVLFAACVGWYCWSNVVKVIPDLPKPGDLSWYIQAARSLLHGQTPYTEIKFDYPPLVGFLALPLAPLEYLPARWVWFALSHLFLLLAAYLLFRFLASTCSAFCCVALVWSFGGAARENLAFGQLGPLLVLILAIAYTQRGLFGGFAAGFGFGLKFIPGVLGLPIALQHKRRMLLGALLGGFVGLVLPWAAMYGLSGPKAPQRADYWMGTPAIMSWSAPSAVLRVLDPATKGPALPFNWIYGNGTNNIHLPERDQRVSVLVGGGILFAGAVLVLLLTSRLPPQHLPFAMAGLISLALAASPISWTHYQLLQYPGLALLLHEAQRRGKWKVFALAIFSGLAIYQIPVAVLTEYFNAYGHWTAESPATLYIWTSVTPAACLLLFGLQLFAARWQTA
jgi:hypothetical protein